MKWKQKILEYTLSGRKLSTFEAKCSPSLNNHMHIRSFIDLSLMLFHLFIFYQLEINLNLHSLLVAEMSLSHISDLDYVFFTYGLISKSRALQVFSELEIKHMSSYFLCCALAIFHWICLYSADMLNALLEVDLNQIPP